VTSTLIEFKTFVMLNVGNKRHNKRRIKRVYLFVL
jgi:hypothetical protein